MESLFLANRAVSTVWEEEKMDNSLWEKEESATSQKGATAGRWLSRLVLCLGMLIIAVLAIPAGLMLLLISGIRAVADWLVSHLEKWKKQ